MGYVDVFDDIVAIMHEDYAGYLDKMGWDHPAMFREKIQLLESSNQLTRRRFIEIVSEYLLDFQDVHNGLRSIDKETPEKTSGFRARRYKDRLYVDEVCEEKRLEKGAIIYTLDGNPIPLLSEKYGKYLMSDQCDREDWSSIIMKALSCEVKHPDGSIEVIRLAHYDKKETPSHYSFEMVDELIGMISVNDFRDSIQMEKLISKHKDAMNNLQALIIDVRHCCGGSDFVYDPLLDFIFQPKPHMKQEAILHNVTERNFKNRLAMFEKLNQLGDPFVHMFVEQMQENKGKGFAEFHFDGLENTFTIKGSEKPRYVIVLTDKYCGSSGEQFVMDVSQSEKVVLIGRPTRGVIDYSHQAIQVYKEEEFEFYYATSKSTRVERGEGLDLVGIRPNIYIQWTPKHLRQDVDLQVALEILKNKVKSNVELA